MLFPERKTGAFSSRAEKKFSSSVKNFLAPSIRRPLPQNVASAPSFSTISGFLRQPRQKTVAFFPLPCYSSNTIERGVSSSVERSLPKPQRRVRFPYPAPSSRTKKDIYAKNPEVSTASGFFCAHFLKLEKKISKRVLAKSVDLNLYPRDFGPLFREFFGKAALFCSRQNVEFRPAFLLVLPNTHSKHRYQRVSQLCDVSDVKTAGKPPPPVPGRNHSVLAMLGREKAKHPLPVQRVVVYLLALSRASVFNVTPIMSLWASRVSRQSGERNVSAF